MARANTAGPKTEELPPCGRCTVIGRNRLEITNLITPAGRPIQIIRRCPTCSPHPAGCGQHVTPPGHACELCLHSVEPRAERPYGGPPPQPPMPNNPGDIQRMSIKELAAEMRELHAPWPMPRRIGPRTERELAALRAQALEHVATSRNYAERSGRHFQ